MKIVAPATIAGRLERVVQQSVMPELGEHKALRACVPTCFYMLSRANGYLAGVSLAEFLRRLDWDNNYTEDRGWLRDDLSQNVRREFGIPVVSWHTTGNKDASPSTIARMQAAGYLSSQREVDFFKRQIVGKNTRQIVNAGLPVILGMSPNFGASDQVHAIIIADWSDSSVEAIDPDQRNPERHYQPEYIQKYTNPTGASTVILPRA